MGSFNQKEIDAWDQHIWRNERINLYNRIRDWCAKHKILFTHNANTISKIPNQKIVYMMLWDQIPSIGYWRNLSDIASKKGQQIFVVSDNFVDSTVIPNVQFFSYVEFLGMAASYSHLPIIQQEHKKLYNCFIQRVDSVRQSWFYFLYLRNLLDRGYVSFLLKQLKDYSTLSGRELFNWIHQNYKLYELEPFNQAWKQLKDSVPFRNFPENFDLTESINLSKYSLVLETYAVDDDVGVKCATEKLIRSLQFPTIPLLFCQRGLVNDLVNTGLAVPACALTVDTLPWQQRQQELLDILTNDSVEYIWTECRDRAEHNRNQLSNFKLKYQRADFFDDMFDSILNA